MKLAEYLERVWEVVTHAALKQVLGVAGVDGYDTTAGALEEDARLTVFSARAGIGFLAPPRTQTQQRQRTTQYPYLLRVPRGRPRQSLQPPPILRVQTLIPVRQLALAHDVPLRSQLPYTP